MQLLNILCLISLIISNVSPRSILIPRDATLQDTLRNSNSQPESSEPPYKLSLSRRRWNYEIFSNRKSEATKESSAVKSVSGQTSKYAATRPEFNAIKPEKGISDFLEKIDINAVGNALFGNVSLDNRYIILLRENVSDTELNQHLSAIQNLLDKFNIGVNAASVYRGIVSQWNFEMTKWKGYVGYFPPSVIEFIKASPLVQLVEIDAPMKLDGLRPTASILSGTGYNGTQGFDISKVTKQSEATWGLDRISRRNSTRTRTYVYPSSAGADVDIYIVDTGVYLDHPEFEKRAIWGAYFNSNGSVATPPPGGDDEGHGTHVAGIAAGKTYGVAKKSRIIAVKVLDKNGYGLVSTIALGIQWAINNTMTTNRRSVINLSLGGERADAKQDSILGRTVQFGTEKGIVFAAAAGNEGIDACNFSPGNLPSLITVGALNELDQRANFSNYGSCVSLYAPGTLITSSLPVTSTSVSKEPIGSGNGTSQACPHVSGVMALILSERKNATTAEVYAALFEAATYGALQASSLQDGDPNLIAYVGFDGVSGNSSIVDIKPSANQNSGTNLPDFNELQSYDFWMIVAYVIRFVWA